VTGGRDSTTSDAASPKPAADDAFIFDGISVRAVAAASQNGDSLLELLSEKERERARAFADESDRIRFVGGRALLRSMLCEHTGIDARAWRFGNGDKGKPFVEAPEAAAEGLAFSVSHAGPGIACAVGIARSVGIDIEPFDREIDVDRLAGRILSPRERDALASGPGGDRRRRMLELWTLKEAVVKASGEGISAMLSGIEISFDEDGRPVLASDAARLSPLSDWTLRQFRTSTGCCGALAVRR
jgi:4'-phosphopantetheinyl transferase